ncbi:MAG: hypothetical protein KC549_06050 [Myxococcales bacterium]|nr:hypothetical protein [Myxococcales bacterium]
MRWIQVWGPGLALLALGGCKNITEGQAEPGAVGAGCQTAEECTEVEDSPTCLKMPGGYCSAECAGGAFDCDDQSICEQLGDQAFFCLDGCLTENGNGDCRGDYRCTARPEVVNVDGREVGVCLPKCQSDGDCEAGRRCDTGSGDCIPRGEKSTGDACSNNAQCNGGLCVQNDSFRGGYCSARCGNQFADCEPGSQCATLDGQALCLDTCQSDRDCRGDDGYRCRQIATRRDQNGDAQAVSVCVPRCQSNDECDDGFHCDAATGDCQAGVGEPNPVGEFCGGAAECQSGECLTGARYPNGYCTAGCDACPAGSVCGDTPNGQKCLAACDTDLDCRAGYVCAGGGCSAPCQGDADCGGGLICNGASGRCVEPSAAGARVEEIDIAQDVPVSGQLSRELTLNVPQGALGFSIVATGSGNDLMIIGEMRDPNGRTIYDFQDPFGSQVRFFPGEDAITQMVPSSPRSAPVPGAYKFRLIKDGGQKNIDVKAYVKIADGEPQGGTLDVNFFFAKQAGLSAGTAAGDADFQAAVGEFKRLYQGRGITIGDVRYCDMNGSDGDRYAVIDSVDGTSSELSQMFALSARAGELGCTATPALNFFLVDEIVGGRAGYIILGVSGGIPGPPGVHGTTHSGVAVTMSGFRRRPRQLAQTMAHEGGHFLGLFHTTEAEGTAFDPLPDTPECRSGKDANQDGLVDYQECLGGSGSENLMFWAAGDQAENVSGDQGFVLLRNPGVK